jgi:hypothetical protein
MTATAYVCARCGEVHEALPFAYGAAAPAYWTEETAALEGSVLGEEQCIIGPDGFFVRGRIVLPVLDADDDFEWGVWVSLSEESFERTGELWETPGREAEPPYFGWLSTELAPAYPSTLPDLAADLITRPVGERPVVVLHDADHLLVREQQRGITVTRVQEIAETLLHG